MGGFFLSRARSRPSPWGGSFLHLVSSLRERIQKKQQIETGTIFYIYWKAEKMEWGESCIFSGRYMYFFSLIQIPDPSFLPLALALCLCILGVFNGRCFLFDFA
jgi:hypothetical protein